MVRTMFGDRDWPLNASRGLSAIAKCLVRPDGAPDKMPYYLIPTETVQDKSHS